MAGRNMTPHPCNYSFDDLNVIVIRTVGMVESLIGIGLNVLILLTYAVAHLPTANAGLLQCLALCDIAVLAGYCILYPASSLAEYTNDIDWYNSWIQIVPYIFAVSRMFQMAASYIVIVAALERYFAINQTRQPELYKRLFGSARCSLLPWLLAVFALCFGSHAVRWFELTIAVFKHESCTPSYFGYYHIAQTELGKVDDYQKIYSVWYTHITNTILPFIVLVILLTLNIRRFGESNRRENETWAKLSLVGKISTDRSAKHKVKQSVSVLLMLIITFLLFNTLGMFISMMELLHKDFLKSRSGFYSISAELINICAITNSTVRLVGYLVLNEEFRKFFMIVMMCGRGRGRWLIQRTMREHLPANQVALAHLNQMHRMMMMVQVIHKQTAMRQENEETDSQTDKQTDRHTMNVVCNGTLRPFDVHQPTPSMTFIDDSRFAVFL